MNTVRLIAIVSPDDQRVSWVELFFDLVFVYCVTQVVTLLHGHIDGRTVASALLVFWLVWWGWTQFTWALNAANTEHPHIQAIMLLATAIAFLLAVDIPHAFTDEALWFAGPYVVLRVIGLALHAWVASYDTLQRAAVRLFSLLSTSGLAAVLIGASLGGSALYWCWGAAIALDLAAAAIGGQLEGWNLHPAHFAERHGLIVIIALGETLIVAASGLVEATRTPIVIATTGLAVAMTGGLWWSYFRHTRELLEHALSGRVGNARASLARDAFSVLHFPMLCGVIAIAAATEAALAHPAETLGVDLRLALGIGTALFVCGTAVAVWRATGRGLPWRTVLIPLAALLYWFEVVPWILFGVLTTILVVIAVVEQRRFATSHTR